MHHTGVQQPHTFRWSRLHLRELPYRLCRKLPKTGKFNRQFSVAILKKRLA
jgi:hypothetical protein